MADFHSDSKDIPFSKPQIFGNAGQAPSLSAQKSGKSGEHVGSAGISPLCPQCGSLVYVRYKDHVFFKDVKSEACKPFIRETIGWLDYEDNECIRVVWERFAQPHIDLEASIRATGIVILKKVILEIKTLA